MNKVRTEAQTLKKDIEAEHDSTLSQDQGMLQSIQGVVKAADERSAGYTGSLTQLRLLFKEGRKIKAFFSSAGLF